MRAREIFYISLIVVMYSVRMIDAVMLHWVHRGELWRSNEFSILNTIIPYNLDAHQVGTISH